MSDKLRELKKATKGKLLLLDSEFKQFFQMGTDIHDTIISLKLRNPIMALAQEYINLEEYLNDPYYLPVILIFAEKIKDFNLANFSKNNNIKGYVPYYHASILKKQIEQLEPYSQKIESLKINKINKDIKLNSSIITHPQDPFIKVNFESYELPQFQKFIELINKAAYHSEFFRLLPTLLRCLFENILHHIFMHGLHKNHTHFFYNRNKYRVRDFSELIYLLITLREKYLTAYCKINQNIIDILKKIKQDGNYSVHQIFEIISSDYADKNKEQINQILTPLLTLYKNIKDKEITIDEDDVEKIRKNLNIPVDESKNKGNTKNKSYSQLEIEEIRNNTTNTESDYIKQEIKFFLEKIETKEYGLILDRFNDERFKTIFDRLFVKIELEPMMTKLSSNSFVIVIGVKEIYIIVPLQKTEENEMEIWKKKSIKEKLKIWLDDFRDRVDLIYKFDI